MSNQAKQKWNRKYNTGDYIFGREANRFLETQSHLFEGERILCLGDGEGRNGVYLAGKGFSVISVDISETGVKKAKNLAHDKGQALVHLVADLSLPLFKDHVFDGACLMFMHVPIEERLLIFEELDRVLKPGAHLIMEVFGTHHADIAQSGPGRLDLLYNKNDLMGMLSGFGIEQFSETVRILDEGRAHQGSCGVTQIIARKQ